jgi:hypothetical protein
MSLAIVFKGPEGIVLAADSRVTLQAQQPGGQTISASFDNATKLLGINGQGRVGVVTYGLGAIGTRAPRTPHSYLPEFEVMLSRRKRPTTVLGFSKLLSRFFATQWGKEMPKNYKGPDIVFLIGGYDKNGTYGRVFELGIPSRPEPKEWHGETGSFGPVWGGQKEQADRLMTGFDPKLVQLLSKELKLDQKAQQRLHQTLRRELGATIPYPFLSLQDSVDLCIFLIQTTASMQTWQVGIRGVGGAIDVATITRTEDFRHIQTKEIRGAL